MVHGSSDCHQTLSLLTLLRFSFRPTVSFTFLVVTCDTCALLTLEGFPLEARGSTGIWKNRTVPYSIHSSSRGVPLWAGPCADSTALPLFALGDPSSEAHKDSQRNFVSSAPYQVWVEKHPLTHRLNSFSKHLLCVCHIPSMLEIYFL